MVFARACSHWLRCGYIRVMSASPSPRQQCEHKLKRWFYSPNVQIKIIIGSQTSTVKIQHRLRYRC